MATTSSKKSHAAESAEDANEAAAVEKPLEELILNKSRGKYQVVELISHHAKILRQQEDYRHLTQTEVLELAMREVLSGDVSEEALMKQILAGPASSGKKDSGDARSAKSAEKIAKKK